MANAYKAKWLILSKENDEKGVYENHAIIVDEGKIVDVVPFEQISNYDIKKVKDYGNCVITPGFVNLLSYLQSTDIGKNHKLSLWSRIKKIFKTINKKYIFAGVEKHNYSNRMADILNQYFYWSRKDKLASFKRGLDLALLSGTTCIAQISREEKYFEIAKESSMKTYFFFELYADSSYKGKLEFNLIKKKIEKLRKKKSSTIFIGVAPNSVCNVHKRLWKVLSKYCRKHNFLMLIHLGESQDEMDWLKYGFSDIDLLHKFLGLKKLSPHTKNLSPVKYLDKLGVLSKNVIVANGNYLGKKDLEELKDRNVKFVYCPRYSDIVHSKKLSFEIVLKYFKGQFGFGTDSLFNNKDLNIFNEAKYGNEGKGLSFCELLKYITIYPAKILRLDNIIGSLEKNKHADFNIYSLQPEEDYNVIFEKQVSPDFVYINGRRVVDKGKIRSYKN